MWSRLKAVRVIKFCHKLKCSHTYVFTHTHTHTQICMSKHLVPAPAHEFSLIRRKGEAECGGGIPQPRSMTPQGHNAFSVIRAQTQDPPPEGLSSHRSEYTFGQLKREGPRPENKKANPGGLVYLSNLAENCCFVFRLWRIQYWGRVQGLTIESHQQPSLKICTPKPVITKEPVTSTTQ